LDIPYGEADKLAKLIPVVRGKPYKLNEMIEKNSPSQEFRDKYQNDSKVKRWIDLAIRIEGTNKTYGVHAAGVVIASESLDKLVPLQRNNEGQTITQYSMDDIESLGLLKMDLSIGSPLTIGLILGVVIITAALLITVERRLLGFWQERLGPNRVGWFGSLQVVADMIKIFTKEDWIPPFADKFSFVVAPGIIMTVVLLSFAVIPFSPNLGVIDSNIGVLFVLAMASLGAYSVMLGGLSSDNKYALLGSLRAAAQMISYPRRRCSNSSLIKTRKVKYE